MTTRTILPAGTLASIAFRKADELLMAMALHALADDAAIEHVEGGEEGRRVRPKDTTCVASLHAPDVECIGKGKASNALRTRLQSESGDDTYRTPRPAPSP